MKRVTQKDVAQKLQLSLKTVQRAFNDSPLVSQKVRDEIFECAQRMGYHPDRAAQALKRQSVRRIAVVSMDSPMYFWSEVQKGCMLAKSQIQDFGFDVTYHYAPHTHRGAYLEKIISICERGIDAIAIVNHADYDMLSVIAYLDAKRIPYAMLNIDLAESDRICFIGPDYYEQGALAAELFSKMLPKGSCIGVIGIMYNEQERLSGAGIMHERYQGFWRYLDQEKLDSDYSYQMLYVDEKHPEQIDEQLRSFLKQNQRAFDGIFCIPPIQSKLIDAFSYIESDELWNPKIIGYDLSPEIQRWLKSGLISAEIHQNPVLQGYGTVKMLEQFLESGVRPETVSYIVSSEVVFETNRNQRSNLEMVLSFD